MIRNSSLLFENYLWKDHVQGCILHVWSENPAFEYWTKKVPLNQCSWIQNKWSQSSCPVPRGLYYSIKSAQKVFTSPTYVEQTLGTINFRVNTCKALREIVHSGILFTSGRCAAAPLIAGGLQQPYDKEPLHIYCKKIVPNVYIAKNAEKRTQIPSNRWS